MAAAVGIWQMCHHAALVVQILFATRVLGLSAGTVGLCYMALGLGTITAGVVGHRLARRLGPGPTMLLGFGTCGAGWSLAAIAPGGAPGVAAFAGMLVASRARAIRETRTLPRPPGDWRDADTSALPDSQPGEFVP